VNNYNLLSPSGAKLVAIQKHLKILNQGVMAWNRWRLNNPSIRPDLSGAKLRMINLSGATSLVKSLRAKNRNFSGNLFLEQALSASVEFENFGGLNLFWANLSGADLSEAHLSGANFRNADLRRTKLYGADLSKTDLSHANLYGADLTSADLSQSTLYLADLTNALLKKANLTGTNLSRAELTDTCFDGAVCSSTIFGDLDLRKPLKLDSICHVRPCAMQKPHCEQKTMNL